MILLYVDESGTVEDAADHFVLGAVAVHETQVRSLGSAIDGILARRLGPAHRDLELHAKSVQSGGGRWRSVPRDTRASILSDAVRLLSTLGSTPGCALFAVAKGPAAIPQADPLERCFEELLLRFTQMLVRLQRHGNEHLGLVIADESKFETVLQPIVQEWRTQGTRFVRLTKLAEVPVFMSSGASRLTQAADVVAHGVYRHYKAADSSLLEPMLGAFDQDGDKIHGLVHLCRNYRSCECYASRSRRA